MDQGRAKQKPAPHKQAAGKTNQPHTHTHTQLRLRLICIPSASEINCGRLILPDQDASRYCWSCLTFWWWDETVTQRFMGLNKPHGDSVSEKHKFDDSGTAWRINQEESLWGTSADKENNPEVRGKQIFLLMQTWMDRALEQKRSCPDTRGVKLDESDDAHHVMQYQVWESKSQQSQQRWKRGFKAGMKCSSDTLQSCFWAVSEKWDARDDSDDVWVASGAAQLSVFTITECFQLHVLFEFYHQCLCFVLGASVRANVRSLSFFVYVHFSTLQKLLVVSPLGNPNPLWQT